MVVRAGRETSGWVAAKLPSAPFPDSFMALDGIEIHSASTEKDNSGIGH